MCAQKGIFMYCLCVCVHEGIFMLCIVMYVCVFMKEMGLLCFHRTVERGRVLEPVAVLPVQQLPAASQQVPAPAARPGPLCRRRRRQH